MRERAGLYQRLADLRPDREQRLLIEAATAAPEDALSAWREWRATQPPLEQLWGPELTVLPAVAERVGDGLTGPDGDRLRGIRRFTWTRNQLVVRLLDRLDAQTSSKLLLIGGPAVAAGTGSVRARRLDPIELLARASDLDRVARALERAGFERSGGSAQQARTWSQQGIELRLTDRPLPFRSSPDPLFEEAEQARAEGISLRLPRPSHLLVSLCLHATFIPPPHPGWAVDALQLLASRGGEIDWDAVETYARSERVRLPLAAALTVLGELGGGEAAGRLAEKLRTPPPRPSDRLFRRLIGGPPRIRKLRWYAHLYWNR